MENKIINEDSLVALKQMADKSINLVVTSPPYWSLRDYGSDKQIGNEDTYQEYLDNLLKIFDEVYRVLKDDGSCWVNIGDVYSSNNNIGIKKQSLIGLPDRFKLAMIDRGWICRNEVIWHKPNAMPSSAKTRFNNDFEKFYFFTKDDLYYFKTQYEEAKTKTNNSKKSSKSNSKYIDLEQEASVRQGMNRARGSKVIEVRPNLPSQEDFVNFIRSKTNINKICESIDIRRTKVEHWFRRDVKGFAYPSIEDWNTIKHLLDDDSDEFKNMDELLTHVEYETDDINKNIHKGRIMRAVWSINTKPYKGCHFAPFPKELIETPIDACCPIGGVVMDIFMGSGTVGVVANNQGKRFIGIDTNKDYCELAKKRIEEET